MPLIGQTSPVLRLLVLALLLPPLLLDEAAEETKEATEAAEAAEVAEVEEEVANAARLHALDHFCAAEPAPVNPPVAEPSLPRPRFLLVDLVREDPAPPLAPPPAATLALGREDTAPPPAPPFPLLPPFPPFLAFPPFPSFPPLPPPPMLPFPPPPPLIPPLRMHGCTSSQYLVTASRIRASRAPFISMCPLSTIACMSLKVLLAKNCDLCSVSLSGSDGHAALVSTHMPLVWLGLRKERKGQQRPDGNSVCQYHVDKERCNTYRSTTPYHTHTAMLIVRITHAIHSRQSVPCAGCPTS